LPSPRPPIGSSTKKEKERLRKERQRQRKMDEAMEALKGAVELMEETAGARGVGAVEEAIQAAEKHEARSEPLAALLVVARDLVEQARAVEAERARVAAEAAAAAAAVEAVAEAEAAAERSQLEEQAAALTMQLQQVQAQLGSSGVPPPAAPAWDPDDAEDQCVLCFDAPRDHIIIPCGHVCVCEACAHLLTQTRRPSCPICRTAIRHTNKVFHA
jgi:hypothetical protein